MIWKLLIQFDWIGSTSLFLSVVYLLHDICVTILKCYKDAYVNSFSPCILRLHKSLHAKYFDVNGFTSCAFLSQGSFATACL